MLHCSPTGSQYSFHSDHYVQCVVYSVFVLQLCDSHLLVHCSPCSVNIETRAEYLATSATFLLPSFESLSHPTQWRDAGSRRMPVSV